MSMPRPQQRAQSLTTAVLLVALPLSCSHEEPEGEVSDPQGCRTIILPEPKSDDASSSSTTGVDEGPISATSTGMGSGASTSMEGADTSTADGSTTEGMMATTGPFCGDGVVDEGNGEECDDGAVNGDDQACTSECKNNVCGDGKVYAGVEACDDGAGNGDGQACLSSCEIAACGDGHVWEGAEACDDGNLDAGDGCSAGCVVERIVFVTSTEWQGDLGGLAGADTKCQALAQGAWLTGSYMAWLSDGTGGPTTRFPASATGFNGDFVLVDGPRVVNGWAELTSGALLHAIDRDEQGAPRSSTVWSNTTADGAPRGTSHCNGWKDGTSGHLGHLGNSNLTSAKWTDTGATLYCNNSNALYCVQVQ